ncbi:hypothetical protein AC578_8692 [Pseudocercospora eumusae]|uniref:Uncharacterized protein n=1 Tax=Pseudocercospora eumusae TaxID=321146 RepID=A0A139HQ38_9PEZI|nr:hypothetical protein AC578_8692 [Pseudocercospora eumusae]
MQQDAETKAQKPAVQQGVLVAYFDLANLPTFAVCILASLVFLYVSGEIIEATWSNPNGIVNLLFNIVKVFGAVVTFKVFEAAINIGVALWVMLSAVQRGLYKLEKRRDDQNWNKHSQPY